MDNGTRVIRINNITYKELDYLSKAVPMSKTAIIDRMWAEFKESKTYADLMLLGKE